MDFLIERLLLAISDMERLTTLYIEKVMLTTGSQGLQLPSRVSPRSGQGEAHQIRPPRKKSSRSLLHDLESLQFVAEVTK